MPTQTAVSVKIPEISVTIEDLAAMTTIQSSNSNGIHCSIKNRIVNRLVFLGLATHGEIPPCPKKIKEYEESRPKLIKKCQDALDKKDWRELYEAAYKLRHDREPTAYEGLILTPAGEALLKTGKASSKTVSGKGCL